MFVCDEKIKMKKTLLATAVALSLGVSAAADAGTAGLTGVWTGTYSFAMFSPGGGPVGAPTAPQSWTWDFDAWEEFQENYEERARWGECSGVTVHYEDGTKKKHKMNAWSNG